MRDVNKEPIFKSVFADKWNSLPIVMKKHYANRPYSNDVVSVEGKMDISYSKLVKLFTPLLRITGILVPYKGKDVPVHVHFGSNPKTNEFRFDRIFYFPDKEPYHFRSSMLQIGRNHNDIVEVMNFGIGWKTAYKFEDNKVILEHKGYILKISSKYIRLPVTFLIGKGSAIEEAVSDNVFKMSMELRHPILGKLFEYKGTFRILKEGE